VDDAQATRLNEYHRLEIEAALRGEQTLRQALADVADRRAALRYYAGLLTHERDKHGASACAWCGDQDAPQIVTHRWSAPAPTLTGTTRDTILVAVDLAWTVLVHTLLPFMIFFGKERRYFDREVIAFELQHRVCDRCHRRLRNRTVLAFIAKAVIGMLMMLFWSLMLVCILLAVGDPEAWWRMGAASAVLAYIATVCFRWAPSRIIVPSPLRRHGQPPFRHVNEI